MRKTKIAMKIIAAGLLAAALMTGCGSKEDETITVLTREESSGTRGAFIELFGIEQKDENGNKVDKTTDSAEETNSTSVMLTTVAGNTQAIGFVSLGSMNDTVKALKIDGVEATAANVKNGTYKVARPFNIAVKEGLSEQAQDFIRFIMSEEGQKIVEDKGYVSQGNSGSYTPAEVSGEVTVGGSSSVTPVMEKLAEAYMAKNSAVKVVVTQSDSTNGMMSTIEGLFDIGMASRDLKDSELSQGLTPTVIAMDGVAVIVNKENTLSEISSENILKIYTGEITKWSEIQ